MEINQEKPLRGHSKNIRVSIIESWALLVMKTSRTGHGKNPQLIMKGLSIILLAKHQVQDTILVH
jgi:hypothetical protein